MPRSGTSAQSSILSHVSKTEAPAPKKKNRVARLASNLKDSYTISKRTYPWIGWALLGILAGSVILAVLLSVITSQPLWYWLFLLLMIALVADMALLSWAVRRASYSQIENAPGAAKAVLDQIRRGWNIEQNPAFIDPKTQDVIWRAVGRPGVVLIAEGPVNRIRRSTEDEARKIKRILRNVPVHTIFVGPKEGQTRLIDLERTMRKLPTKPTSLTDTEVAEVSKRLTSLNSKGLPIPKGIDPSKVRPDHRALRGR
ncbi:Uncharacterised protein [Actinomyces bovis]|uniref:DUF4191 domain-containing protein n=1 Tax=Actinomyces bovis TaxID=1658 RepID=A0ABY1VSV5_9ACTO|nr:DUF4191 domain-containing protein [Actinomyces bovis]SPT54118.1 Uncharacterised protein [Actinomyces bovis]VEG53639.1 Uncharacterised protein [Actinomyces israelii]